MVGPEYQRFKGEKGAWGPTVCHREKGEVQRARPARLRPQLGPRAKRGGESPSLVLDN